MARRGRKSKHSVKLGWKEIKQSCSWFFWKFWSCLCRVHRIFALFLPFARFFRWPSKTYTIDRDGTVTCRPSIWERLATSFRSDATNKRRLLEWAQKHLPKDFKVHNYTTSWSDGITLCALLETLCPGACPRYDLLKQHHKVNNCRLGLKLAQKHFGIPQTIITAEEMSLSAAQSEAKMRQLLSLIKWASLQRQDEKENESQVGQVNESQNTFLGNKSLPCTVKGSGLLVGIVGKRCKFDLFPPVSETLDILIEVKGPNNMFCCERITSLFPKSRRNSYASADPVMATFASLQEAAKRHENESSKLLGHDLAGKDEHRRSTDLTGEEITKIPFDYKCVGEGQIQISYVPRSNGQHAVTVKWHGKHIRGSPFAVIVAETLEKLNAECKGIVRHKQVKFDKGELVINKTETEAEDSAQAEVSVTVQKPSPTTEQPPELTNAVTAAVLSRSSKVQRSISRSGINTQKLATQTTITRRRVLKRIITTGGQEIVIHETSETPISSREGSRDNDSTSSLADSNSSAERRRSVTSRNQSTTKSFDCEIIYDSDVGVPPIASPKNAPIDHLLRKVALEGFIRGVVERILDNVMKQVHMNNIKRCAEESMKMRQRSPKHKMHPRLGSRMSLPLQTTASSNNLLPPTFDVKFQCSPYTGTKELPWAGPMKEKITDKLSLPPELLEPDDDGNNGHKKLCATKSAPMNKSEEQVSDKEQNRKNFNKWISSWIDAHCHVTEQDKKSDVNWPGVDEKEETSEKLCDVKKEDKDMGSMKSAKVRTGEELTRSETETSNESSRVTVRTQMKERKCRNKEIDVEKEQKKQLNPTFGRACIMNMESITSNEAKLSKRSLTLPADPSEADDDLHRDGFEPKAPQAEGSNLKILQSNSTRKSCLYMSQKAIVESSQSSDSPGQTSTSDSIQSFDINSWSHDNSHFTRPKLKSTISKLQLRMSASLPTLSKNWTAFEIDPDDDSLSMEEMERLSVAAQASKKRMTLGESELSDVFTQRLENRDGRESSKMYSDMKSMRKDVKQDSLGSDLSVGLSPSPNPSVDLNTPYNASPNVSPFSSPGQSRVGSRRGSISRHDVSTLQKVSEERNSLEEALSSIQQISEFSPNLHSFHKPEEKEMAGKAHEKQTLKVTSSSPNQLGINIKVPKATIDRWTQVKYEEIKEATGWTRPTTYVKPRPRIIRKEAVHGISSFESDSGDQQPRASRGSTGGTIPMIICQRDEQGSSESQHSDQPSSDIRNFLNTGEDRLQPVRQSTVDTIDSGIADENGSPKTTEKTPPRRVQKITPLPAFPTGPTKPRFINGHRAVTRSRYRGKITLDPKLVSGHGSQSTTSSDDIPHRRKVGITLMRYSRSNSDARRGKRRMPSREESVSDTENRGLRKRQSYRGACYKRRVTFSRRVLMYRRSSSRNSSRNSRSRDDSCNVRHSTDPLLEVTEPQTGDKVNHDVSKTKSKHVKPRLRRKAQAETRWLSQLSRESRESMESGSSSSKRSSGSSETSQTKVRQTESLPNNSSKKQPTQVNHRRSPSADLIKDFDHAKDVCEESNDVNDEEYNKDSIDGFDGYGLTADRRKSLIDELEAFNRLASGAKISLNNTPQYGTDGRQSSVEEMSKYKEPLSHLSSLSTECQTPDIVIHSEDSPFCRVILKAEECVPIKQKERLFTQNRDTAFSFDTEEKESKQNLADDISRLVGETADSENFTMDFAPGMPDPFRCRAVGMGLKLGHVGIKNNFQVFAKTAGNGALSVAISGPRQRTVSETSLTYTGDDLYEVFYEVTQPGIYLINVKWNEFHIQDSPFVCQVTY